MPATVIVQDVVWEDAGATLLARVVGHNAAVINQATLSGIRLTIRDLNARTNVVNDEALTVSAVVFDTLQTDAVWTKDATGYNFKYAVDDDVFTSGDHRYRVVFTCTPASGADFHVVFEITAKKLLEA